MQRFIHTRNLLELYREDLQARFPRNPEQGMNEYLILLSRPDVPVEDRQYIPLAMNGESSLYGRISNQYVHNRQIDRIEHYVLATPTNENRNAVIRIFEIVFQRSPTIVTDELIELKGLEND